MLARFGVGQIHPHCFASNDLPGARRRARPRGRRHSRYLTLTPNVAAATILGTPLGQCTSIKIELSRMMSDPFIVGGGFVATRLESPSLSEAAPFAVYESTIACAPEASRFCHFRAPPPYARSRPSSALSHSQKFRIFAAVFLETV